MSSHFSAGCVFMTLNTPLSCENLWSCLVVRSRVSSIYVLVARCKFRYFQLSQLAKCAISGWILEQKILRCAIKFHHNKSLKISDLLCAVVFKMGSNCTAKFFHAQLNHDKKTWLFDDAMEYVMKQGHRFCGESTHTSV